MTSITDKEFKALENFSTDLTAGNTKTTMKQVGATSAELWKVPIDQIHILAGYNPRIPGPKYEEKIEWLTNQILEQGYFQDKPLAGFATVENGVQKIYVQDGQSRLLAARRAVERGAPIDALPVVLKDRSKNLLDLTIALVTSNEGEVFSAMEKAALVKRFRSFDKTDTEIATFMRCSPAYVVQLATLAGAPKKIRDMIISDEISATNAIEAIRKHGDKAVEVLSGALDKAKASGKTKASAKDDAGSAVLARQKKHGPALYEMVIALLEHGETVIPESMQQDLDSLLFKIEDAGAKEVAASKGEALL